MPCPAGAAAASYIVVVGFLPKGETKTVLSIQRTTLPDRPATEKANQ